MHVQPPDDIGPIVSRIFAEVLGRESVPPRVKLSSIGLDSLAMVDVSVRIEAALGIEMPDLDELARLRIETLDELIEVVRQRVSS